MKGLPKTAKKLKNLRIAGVYFLLDGEVVVYIGQSTDIHTRIKSHELEGEKKYDSVYFIECPKRNLKTLEMNMIIRYDPKYNIQGSGKAKKIKQYLKGGRNELQVKDLIYLK